LVLALTPCACASVFKLASLERKMNLLAVLEQAGATGTC
jgi:hypothetical protein